MVVRVIQKREGCGPILHCDVQQSREIRNDRRERRIARIENRTDLPPVHSLPGRRTRERRHCEFHCHLLGMGLESSARFVVAAEETNLK